MALEPSGVKVDIKTGHPIFENAKTKRDEAEAKLHEAVSQSLALQAELRGEGGMVLEALIEQTIAHAEAVLAEDPVYQHFLSVLMRLGRTVNIAPIIMERHLKRVLPSYERRPAPEGIPDGE
jgi:hypothetical protein